MRIINNKSVPTTPSEIAGAEYAVECYRDGCTETIDYNRELCSIPDGDYHALKSEGVEPDDREYWAGYNVKILELTNAI